MPQYFKNNGEQLITLGYPIVPLPPGSKGPRIKGWQNLDLSIEQARKMAANGSAEAGAGILAARVPAIDVDVMDESAAEEVNSILESMFGPDLLARVGQAPKFLVPFRSEEPFRKLSSNRYTDGTHDHRIEILGEGQQWVAFHIHPTTRQPYYWGGGRSIMDVAHSDLPLLTRDDAQRVIDAFEALASERVDLGIWRLASPRVTPSKTGPDDDPFASYAQPVSDLSNAQIESLLRKLPLADRDGWLRAGRILHHQFEGAQSGFDFWVRISEDSEKFDVIDQQRVWESFGHRSDAPETIRALIKDFGQPAKPLTDSEKAFRFHAGNDYASDFAGAPELVEDVLPAQGIGMLFGPSNDGKSTWALDLAFHVHNGIQWRDKDVTRGDVMYIAAEAGRSIKKRIQAVRLLHPDWDAPFIADIAPNLSAEGSLQAVSDAAKAVGTAAFLIVDTMSASFEGDDSSQQDVAKMMRNLKILADDLQCAVMFVHHTTKEGGSWRGSGVLFNDGDFVLELEVSGEGPATKRWVKQRKHRDGEVGKSYPFALAISQPIGYKPNGKPITSVTIEQADFELPERQKKGKKQAGGDFETSSNYRKARAYLAIIEREMGIALDANIDEADVIKAIQNDENENAMKFPDHPPVSNIKRTLLTLADQGKIRREGRWIRLS